MAKRNDLHILRDVEQLFYDKISFFELLHRNIEAIAPAIDTVLIALAPTSLHLKVTFPTSPSGKKSTKLKEPKTLIKFLRSKINCSPDQIHKIHNITIFTNNFFDYTKKSPNSNTSSGNLGFIGTSSSNSSVLTTYQKIAFLPWPQPPWTN